MPFSGWFGLALVLGAYVLVAAPVLLFVHELGHVLAVLALTDGRPTVVLGSTDGRRFVAGPLAVRFDPVVWRQFATGGFGVYRYDAATTRWRTAAIALAGPATTLVVLLAAFAAIPTLDGPALFLAYAVFWNSAIRLVATLVPMRYPSWWGAYDGLASDGLRAWRALSGE